jgi:hypothetical protein
MLRVPHNKMPLGLAPWGMVITYSVLYGRVILPAESIVVTVEIGNRSRLIGSTQTEQIIFMKH